MAATLHFTLIPSRECGTLRPVEMGIGGSGQNVVKLPDPAAKSMFEFRDSSRPRELQAQHQFAKALDIHKTIAVVVAKAGMIRPAVT